MDNGGRQAIINGIGMIPSVIAITQSRPQLSYPEPVPAPHPWSFPIGTPVP
jgi:hypothetical protein